MYSLETRLSKKKETKRGKLEMKKDEEYPVHKMNDYFVHQVIIILLVLFKPTRMRDTLKKGKRHRIMSIS